MSLFINLLQFFNRVMCIHLCSAQVGMTEYFFDAVDIGAMIQHVCGKSMAQHMRTFTVKRSHAAQAAGYYPVNKLQ